MCVCVYIDIVALHVSDYVQVLTLLRIHGPEYILKITQGNSEDDCLSEARGKKRLHPSPSASLSFSVLQVMKNAKYLQKDLWKDYETKQGK